MYLFRESIFCLLFFLFQAVCVWNIEQKAKDRSYRLTLLKVTFLVYLYSLDYKDWTIFNAFSFNGFSLFLGTIMSVRYIKQPWKLMFVSKSSIALIVQKMYNPGQKLMDKQQNFRESSIS